MSRRADALFELTDAVLCADGPVTSLVGLFAGAPADTVAAAAAAVGAAFTPHANAGGVVLNASVWLVSARR